MQGRRILGARQIGSDERRLVLRLWARLLLGLAVSLAAVAPAAAHGGSGPLSTDFEAHVGSFHASAPGLAARVLDGDQRLELRVAPPEVVVVLGLTGEPFLRFSPAGVEANLASPTSTSTRVIKAIDAVLSPRVIWRRVSRGHVLAWHEGRLRPMQVVRNPSTRPREVTTWSIPLLVDGRRTELVGTEWYSAGPSLWPWLVAGALLIAGAVLGARRLSTRMQRLLAPALLSVAVGALLAGWLGIFLAGRVTWPAVLIASVGAGVSALFVLAAIAASSGMARQGVIALIGAFTATFALPEIPVFGHGFVLSALPATVARLAVATAVVGGIATAIVCVPAVIVLFDSSPTGYWPPPRGTLHDEPDR